MNIMDMLCIADMHGDREAVTLLKTYAEACGFKNILILGDFPGHSTFKDTKKSIDEIRFMLDTLGDFNVLAIPGNCDPPETVELLEEYNVNLHEKSVILEDVTLVGLGGSAPTPFDTPFEMSEEDIYKKLENLLEGVKTEKKVVVAHNPPYNTNCDVCGSGDHVGSTAMRKIIDKFQPTVFLCSHIHESGGCRDVLGKTTVVNIGQLSQRKIGVLHLDDVNMELCVF